MRLYVQNGWICKKNQYPKLHKLTRKLCTLDVRFFQICRKIEHLELCKLNRKLCTLYVWIVWICRKIEYPELRNSTENCVHYMNELLGFAEIVNIQNCVNSTENVYIRCTDCLDL